MTPKQQTAEAVHSSALVIDTHADTPQRFLDEHFDLADPLGGGNLNLESARKGNLGAEFFSIWVEPVQYKGQYAHRTLELIDAVKQQAAKHPGQIEFVTTPAGIEAAHRQHKLAALMGIEGGHSIENSIPVLRQYYALGVRYMTLTWSNSNDWADSSGDIDDPTIPHHNGLTPFGREVIAEMNRLGMMIDLSHVSDRTFDDVLAVTRTPVLVSHSAARALTASHRNLTDDQLRALAANGGVCMVNFYPAFIDEPYRQAWAEQKSALIAAHKSLAAEYAAKGTPVPYHIASRIDREFAGRLPRPPLSSLIEHFDHIIQVAGIDHVGIGTDFDGICALPEGINSAADLPKITAALLARGHSPADLHKLLGANLLRLFAATQTASDILQTQSS
jgi:membrane dipeptidase